MLFQFNNLTFGNKYLCVQNVSQLIITVARWSPANRDLLTSDRLCVLRSFSVQSILCILIARCLLLEYMCLLICPMDHAIPSSICYFAVYNKIQALFDASVLCSTRPCSVRHVRAHYLFQSILIMSFTGGQTNFDKYICEYTTW